MQLSGFTKDEASIITLEMKLVPTRVVSIISTFKYVQEHSFSNSICKFGNINYSSLFSPILPQFNKSQLQ